MWTPKTFFNKYILKKHHSWQWFSILFHCIFWWISDKAEDQVAQYHNISSSLLPVWGSCLLAGPVPVLRGLPNRISNGFSPFLLLTLTLTCLYTRALSMLLCLVTHFDKFILQCCISLSHAIPEAGWYAQWCLSTHELTNSFQGCTNEKVQHCLSLL